ncbi:probable C-mannosyltransferase DPY19L1 [Eurytemora carolleeae]|uniref:probable C-mannosyltransferase DPY19L1 n=1 Tax=Eurytemora carolleeae TaxID=1294199 RepID=UPI000C7643C5|nr:probable C-mannosyltransferase DPY19L1 [Eurytemora carolleeae]XP_023338052.1 probable C-mannosyltransferase DPY19L1 [Eurytemora carolleeae]|eukprot:XP_023338051.1 probable C-mannosyltransferase DPY19L1 [Eurytemora affinis]
MVKEKKKKIHVKLNLKEEEPHWSTGNKCLVVLLAIVLGGVNHYHVSSLFENDRHFSHLSNMEREMTFRTEMGLYYSYFKTIVSSESLTQGVYKLYRNNVTEYPDTINTLKRFNLYPELVVGALYRGFNNLGLLSEVCWTVNRGKDLDPVQSCEGLKDPPHFYLAFVWLCAGATVSILFILGVYLSDSIMGGLLASLCFFFNHGECTRVMWTPPLRESFAFPICLLQILSVSITTRSVCPNWKNLFSTAFSTSAFILCWQFAQFMLFTQCAAVFSLYILGLLHKDVFSSIIVSLLIGLLHSVALMFGNEMLFCSWFFSSLLSSLLLVLLLDGVLNHLPSLLRVPTQGVLFLVLTVGAKLALSRLLLVQDDAHVFEIFKSKFSDFKNFNTQLYTCAAEFDFLGWEMPYKISLTLLLPAAVVAVILVVLLLARAMKSVFDGSKEVITVDPAVVYNVLQAVAYAALAIMIMRLKLFLTPQLCILSSLLASPTLISSALPTCSKLNSRELQTGFIVVLLASMGVKGAQNIKEQWNIIGEYSDPQLEEMFEWIMKNTPTNAVFAGPMPTMANLLLSTERPIVNHPHYEDVGSRERTKTVYSVFSRKEVEEVYKLLEDIKVDYLVLARSWCLSIERGGCAIPELWDLEDIQNIQRPAVCPVLWKDGKPFKKVFQNQDYKILQIRRALHISPKPHSVDR